MYLYDHTLNLARVVYARLRHILNYRIPTYYVPRCNARHTCPREQNLLLRINYVRRLYGAVAGAKF